jgi:hypothetical protein
MYGLIPRRLSVFIYVYGLIPWRLSALLTLDLLLLSDKTSYFLLKFEEVLRSGMALRGLESVPDIVRHDFTLLDVTFASRLCDSRGSIAISLWLSHCLQCLLGTMHASAATRHEMHAG